MKVGHRAGSVALFWVLAMLAGGWELPVTRARRMLKEYVPARLHQSPTGREPSGAVRTIRVRLHADSACRAGVSGKARFRLLLARVNDFVRPGFNVEFAIEEMRPWDSKLPATQLDEILEALVTHDPGEDVDLVIGCVSPLQIETSSTHEAGRARIFGKHFVLRPLSDAAEERSFREAFYALDKEELEATFAARAAHKSTVFFLHEWAHTLGGMHEREPQWLLHPVWEPKQGAFSYINPRVMEIALRHRLSDDYDRAAEAAELLGFLKSFNEEWSHQDRASILRFLEGQAGGRNSDRLPVEGGKTGGGPTPSLDEAGRLVEANDTGAAQDALNEAQRQAEAAGTTDARFWGRFAELCLAVGAYTQGEAAVEKAGEALVPSARRSFQRARLQVGLPAAHAFVAPEFESIYSARFWEVVGLLNDQKLKEADRAITRSRMFDRTPGFQLLRCELAGRSRQAAEGRRRCEAALALSKELPRAHVLLAMFDASEGRNADAIKHLETAIALDPDDKGAWLELARLQKRQKRTAELSKLRASFAAAFGEEMPPP